MKFVSPLSKFIRVLAPLKMCLTMCDLLWDGPNRFKMTSAIQDQHHMHIPRSILITSQRTNAPILSSFELSLTTHNATPKNLRPNLQLRPRDPPPLPPRPPPLRRPSPLLLTPPSSFIFSLQEVAPIAYAFLGGSYLSSYLAPFHQLLSLASASLDGGKADYVTPHHPQRGHDRHNGLRPAHPHR